jgi:3',5'-cyclic AMP phosphodiesterase CpdA
VLRVLHLSDLHFGQLLPDQRAKEHEGHSGCAHKFHSAGKSDPTVLANVLRGDSSLGVAPHAIVVTGDIGWAGVYDDYIPAMEFMRELRLKWADASVVLLPGNHDVNRSTPAERQTAFVSFAREFYGDQFTAVFPFYAESGDRALLVNIQHLTVPVEEGAEPSNILIVGVNSAAALEDRGTPVQISPKALERLSTYLKSRSHGDSLRIFALHHHLLPFAEARPAGNTSEQYDIDRADPTIVGNSAKLQSWLAQHEFTLVLHGHKHKSHGRLDTLWRRTEPIGGRTILTVGAGSAGVHDGERTSEPLSYNILNATRLTPSRWNVNALVQEVDADTAVHTYARTQYRFSAEIGPKPTSGNVSFFHAERMDDCHAAISHTVPREELVRTFVSVVDTCQYLHPSTVLLDGSRAQKEDVVRSFSALHPEVSLTEKWANVDGLEWSLRNVPERFQFAHGPRLFGLPSGVPSSFVVGPEGRLFRPILKALSQLETSTSAHAYVGLFRPEIDVLSSRNEPLPSLMSLQFLKDGDSLDLVATFRKLELSFWWVVNMYEAIELLNWAAGAGLELINGKRRNARRITFFAALAEWKEKPEAAFVAKLDALGMRDLTGVALSAISSPEGRKRLYELLSEKLLRTNTQNLDHNGLEQLAHVLAAIVESRKNVRQDWLRISEHLANAAEEIRPPVLDPARASTRCREALAAAVERMAKLTAQGLETA